MFSYYVHVSFFWTTYEIKLWNHLTLHWIVAWFVKLGLQTEYPSFIDIKSNQNTSFLTFQCFKKYVKTLLDQMFGYLNFRIHTLATLISLINVETCLYYWFWFFIHPPRLLISYFFPPSTPPLLQSYNVW